MLNPSKAGHNRNDATTTLTVRFGRIFRTTDHIAVNLFALIDTYPDGLTKVDDPIGPNNDDWIKMAIDFATTHGGLIVVAWGNHGKLLDRSSDVRKMLDGYPNIYCFGLTKQGEPRFPRAISYDQPLVPFRIRGSGDE